MEIDIIKPPDWKMNQYKVAGKNPATNRKKKVSVVSLSNDEQTVIARSGLIDVDSVSLVFDEPSNEQLGFASDLGIPIDCSFSKQDYSALISKATGDEPNDSVPLDVARFAERINVYLSSFTSFPRAYNDIYYKMNLFEKIEFFAFSVYQYVYGFACYDYIHHSNVRLFNNFAAEHVDDNKFIKSLNCYCGADLLPNHPIKNSYAFQVCKKSL